MVANYCEYTIVRLAGHFPFYVYFERLKGYMSEMLKSLELIGI